MRQLLSIQVLRAVAALAVVVEHGRGQLDYWTGTSLIHATTNAFSAGVDLFFVISGFIIIISAWDGFGRTEAIAPFALRRLVRIGFLYWLITSIYVATGHYPLDRVVASYLLLPPHPIHVLEVAWTLTLEMMFYGLVAAALILPRALALPAIVAVLAGLTLTSLPAYSNPVILEFVYGIVIAVAYQNGVRFPARASIALTVIALAAFVALNLYVPQLPRAAIWGGPAALLLAAAALGPALPLTRLTLFAAAIGDASYALYLIHTPVVRAVSNLARLSGIDFNASPVATALYFILAIAAATGVALLLYRFVEAPMLSYAKRWTMPARAVGRASEA